MQLSCQTNLVISFKPPSQFRFFFFPACGTGGALFLRADTKGLWVPRSWAHPRRHWCQWQGYAEWFFMFLNLEEAHSSLSSHLECFHKQLRLCIYCCAVRQEPISVQRASNEAWKICQAFQSTSLELTIECQALKQSKKRACYWQYALVLTGPKWAWPSYR